MSRLLNGTFPAYNDGERFTGYDQFTDPTVSLEFALSMRSGHAMVPKGVVLRQKGQNPDTNDCTDGRCCNWGSDGFAAKLGLNENSIRFCHSVNSFQNEIRDNSIDDIVRGMASQTAPAMTPFFRLTFVLYKVVPWLKFNENALIESWTKFSKNCLWNFIFMFFSRLKSGPSLSYSTHALMDRIYREKTH